MDFPTREEILEAARLIESAPNNWQDMNEWVSDVNHNLDIRYSVAHGASKIVVFLEDSDWVVKAPIRSEKDYCRIEAENWAYAKREGVAYGFVPCFYYGTPYSYPIYLQQKVRVDTDNIVFQFLEDLAKRRPLREDEDEDDYTGILTAEMDLTFQDKDRISILFGDDKLLMDFIGRHHINDLNEDNFGFRGGRVVIFDFSGYEGGTE